ncbi:MAG TPA: MarR family transcriptional regulator [Burkholderiales bacterium]|jgi:DNA-binding MarR family transcriptional regulator|nr:MarR family transcriptional regulator [Burkholderiales bacterium]
MLQRATPTIRELLSYRLHQVANLLSRGAEMRYRREFSVSLWEWRTIALLGGAAEAQSLNDLARAAGVDKAQMSRVVSGLRTRKLVSRVTDAKDGRGIRLSLTRSGARLYQRLIEAAAERNSAFLGCLSVRERASLERIMTKLVREARSFIHQEKGGR